MAKDLAHFDEFGEHRIDRSKRHRWEILEHHPVDGLCGGVIFVGKDCTEHGLTLWCHLEATGPIQANKFIRCVHIGQAINN